MSCKSLKDELSIESTLSAADKELTTEPYARDPRPRNITPTTGSPLSQQLTNVLEISKKKYIHDHLRRIYDQSNKQNPVKYGSFRKYKNENNRRKPLALTLAGRLVFRTELGDVRTQAF